MSSSVAPSDVLISSVSEQFKDGDEVPILIETSKQFDCITRGVKPAPSLSWTLGGSNVDGQQVNTPNGDLFDSVSTYNLQADMGDHNKQLICKVSSTPPADPVSISTTVTIFVQGMFLMIQNLWLFLHVILHKKYTKYIGKTVCCYVTENLLVAINF